MNRFLLGFVSLLAACSSALAAGPPSTGGFPAPVPLSLGGTGGRTPSTARLALGAAASGRNVDVTGLTGLLGALGVNEVVSLNLGAGASILGAPQAPGTGANVTTGIVPSFGGAGCNVGDRIGPSVLYPDPQTSPPTKAVWQGPAVFTVDTLSGGPPVALTATFSGGNMIVTGAGAGSVPNGTLLQINGQPGGAPGVSVVSGPGGGPGIYAISTPLSIATPSTVYAGGSVATMHMNYGGKYSVLPYLTPATMENFGYFLNTCEGTQVTLTPAATVASQSGIGIQLSGSPHNGGVHLQINADGIGYIEVGSRDIGVSDAAYAVLGFFGRNDTGVTKIYSSWQFVEASATTGLESARLQIGGYQNGVAYQEAEIGNGMVVGSPGIYRIYNQDGPGKGIFSAVNGYAVGASAPTGNGFIYWLDGLTNATFNTVTTNTQCTESGVYAATCNAGTIEADRGVVPLTGAVTFTPGSSTIAWGGAAIAADQPIVFEVSGGALPPELTAGTPYFIYGYPTATSFKVATSLSGPAIVPSTAGSGTQTATVVFNGPFTPLRVVSNDGQARASSIAGAQGAVEIDLIKAGPDDRSVNVMADIVGREGGGPSVDGPTSIWRGLRIRPEANQNGATGPVEINRAFEASSSFSYPGSSIDYALISDSARWGVYLSSAQQTSITTTSAAPGSNTLTFSNVYPAAASISGVKFGDLVCENTNCASPVDIPAGTTVTSVTNVGTSTTLTLSNPIGSDGIALGASITTIAVFTDGLNFSGHYSDSVVKLASQYGNEMTVLNGATFGNAVGGAMGLGSINLHGLIYQDGQPLNQQFTANVPTSPGVAMPTNSPILISSINLPAGNFDLSTNVVLFPSSTLVLDNLEMAIGWGTGYCGSPAVLPSPPNFGAYTSFLGPPVTNPRNFTMPSGKMHFSSFVPIEVCTVAQAQFTGSGASLVAGSYMTAERVLQ